MPRTLALGKGKTNPFIRLWRTLPLLPALMSCAIPWGGWSSLTEVSDFFLMKRLKVRLLSENIHNYTFKMHTMTRLSHFAMFCVFKTQ